MGPVKKLNPAANCKRIIEAVSEYYALSDAEIKKIKAACNFAQEVYKGETYPSNHDPYMAHATRVAYNLLNVQPDVDTIVAALLHGVMIRKGIGEVEIEQKFGSNVKFLCTNFAKIWQVALKHKTGHDDYIKRLLLAMAEDIRVIYIQLADLVDILESDRFENDAQRRQFAENTLGIYVSIAEKLNLFHFKGLLEDLAFKILYPEAYKTIAQEIRANKTEREKFVQKAIETLTEILKKDRIPVIKIEGRPKNFYSIYQKMKRKGYASISDVYDLFALRIITTSEGHCYRTLGAIHAHWKPLPQRFKDYIAVPKANGYRSLHTTILGMLGSSQPTEIQIKTQDMYLAAEFGTAAHWAYKQRKGSHFGKEFLLKHDWGGLSLDKDDSADLIQSLSQNLFEERIHVFTPKGEIKHVPKGGTPIDFAYAIHSEIGDTSIGAKVNGRIKPLHYELKPGDVVEIQTKTGRHPNPLWLNFVKSSQAKNKIRAYLNKREKEDSEPEPAVRPEKKPRAKVIPKEKTTPLREASGVPHQKESIMIGGTKTKSYRLPKCCDPYPFVPIVAYNSRGLEFVIHRQNCKMIEYLDSARFLDAYFLRHVKFEVVGFDRVGILTEITDCIARNGINVRVCTHKVAKKERVHFKFEAEYVFDDEIRNLFEQIKKISNVESIEICPEKVTKKAKKS